jgi:hypothetical protein
MNDQNQCYQKSNAKHLGRGSTNIVRQSNLTHVSTGEGPARLA